MIHFYRKHRRIGLDIDEVCANFSSKYLSTFGPVKNGIHHFNFSYDINKNLENVGPDFWLDLQPMFDPTKLNFLPTCYISRRHTDQWVTEKWLEKNGFPCMPVIHVKDSKVEDAKKMNINYYVDDYIKNYQELNEAGIETFLMNCFHNKNFNVGNSRIYDIFDLPAKIMQLEE